MKHAAVGVAVLVICIAAPCIARRFKAMSYVIGFAAGALAIWIEWMFK